MESVESTNAQSHQYIWGIIVKWMILCVLIYIMYMGSIGYLEKKENLIGVI